MRNINMQSPYKNALPSKWEGITKKLIKKHPLSANEIKNTVLSAWEEIFFSRVGQKPYRIGKEIKPKPQIMGFFLHELIVLAFEKKYPGKWKKEQFAKDKDMTFIPNNIFSIEIKTSSNPTSIFGNRSYAQKSQTGRKEKSGFYLAVNFEKFQKNKTKPRILKIRFGWLDHEDWMGQKSPTGQQARLRRKIEDKKLINLYTAE